MLFKTLLVIILSVSGVLSLQGWGVTYTPVRICALKGSSVDMRCTYSYPRSYTVQKTYWFISDWNSIDGDDLLQDTQYSHRVEYLGDRYNDSTFRIKLLKESDSALYRFRFLTDREDGKYTGGPGVFLTVTGLQVKVTENEGQSVTLTCSSTCTLSGSPNFTWYKNGKGVSNEYKYSLNLASTDDTDIFSCARGGVTSPAVNVKCVKVEMTSSTVSEGEMVTLTCKITCTDLTGSQTFIWYKNGQFLQNHDNLQLKASSGDTGSYSCAVRGHENLPSAAVTLCVRCVKVEMSSTVSKREKLRLTCELCTDLTGNPTFTWSKNGQVLQNTPQKYQYHNYLHFKASSEDTGSYSCAVRGQENLLSPMTVTLYPPKSTSVSVSPSGEIVEGTSVTLTCSSDANPPVQSYTWFKKNDTGVWQAGSGQSLNFSNFRSWNSGHYYCESQNRYGAQNASALLLTVQGGQSLIMAAAVGVAAILAIVFLGVLCVRIIRRRKSTNEAEGGRQPSSTRNQDQVLYSTVQPASTRNHEPVLYSTVQKPLPQSEEGVQYASVKFPPSSAAPRSSAPSVKEDCVYSTVRKQHT